MDSSLLIISSSALISCIILSYTINPPAYSQALLIFPSLLCLFWLFIRKVFIYCIFPGSLWTFKRSLEIMYSKEVSQQVFNKLEILKINLIELKTNPKDSLYKIDPEVKSLLNTLVENLGMIENKTKAHKTFQTLLSKLNLSLDKLTVNVKNRELVIWSWFELFQEGSDQSFEFLLTENNKSSIDSALDLIDSIQATIKPNLKEKTCISRFFSVFYCTTIGNLDYMRSDLLKRFNCEQFKIGFIDSVFVKSDNTSELAVMICNPNAGFYEFTYFQSEWLEFYLIRGISVILWNYRGYGLSAGRPDVHNIVSDGLQVAEFYIKNQKLLKLAFHGESIGGFVAIQIAQKLDCHFLLADRTFGCLSDVIKYNYGRFAYWLYRVALLCDCENTQAYLSLTCCKVLAADPSDQIIPDYVSLKATVALSLLLKQNLTVNKYLSSLCNSTSYVLNRTELIALSRSLSSLLCKLHSMQTEGISEKNKIFMKTEDHKDEETQALASKLLKILGDVDSCGVSLEATTAFPLPVFSLQLWIMTIEIWGSFGGSFLNSGSSAVAKSISDLKEVIFELKHQPCQDLHSESTLISATLTKILSYLQEVSNRSLNSARTEDSRSHEYSKAGEFLLVSCGHGGHYTNLNLHNLEIHLINSSFL